MKFFPVYWIVVERITYTYMCIAKSFNITTSKFFPNVAFHFAISKEKAVWDTELWMSSRAKKRSCLYDLDKTPSFVSRFSLSILKYGADCHTDMFLGMLWTLVLSINPVLQHSFYKRTLLISFWKFLLKIYGFLSIFTHFILKILSHSTALNPTISY